jgi:hypothetical protein
VRVDSNAMPVAPALVHDLLVPPARLAASLTEARTMQNLTLSDMEIRARGAFSLGELAQIEAGQLALRDPDLRVLASVYGIDLAKLVPGRACLVIDREEGRLDVGGSHGKFSPHADDRKIMLRYLALVYRIRNATPGKPISSRDDDLAVLATVFGTTPEDVRQELEALMSLAAPEIRFQYGAFRNRLVVPTLGVLVALTAAGGLLLTSSAAPVKAAATGPAAAGVGRVNIGDAVTIERAAFGRTNIGDARTIER